MLKINFLFFTLFGLLITAQSQTKADYLSAHATPINLNKVAFPFKDDFYENQVFLYGFVHGSATPQIIDFELLKNLHQKGLRYYAPEMDHSAAYFFNQYLLTGAEAFLDYGCKYYKYRVPQDASIQFKNKWKKIYQYNQMQTVENQLTILGFDIPIAHELTLTHLAFIAPEKQTNIPVVDSLKHFKNLITNEINIISGKPVYKSGKGWDYFFGTPKTAHYKRFVEAYQNDSTAILEAFGKHANDVRHLMYKTQAKYRDEAIFENFKKMGLSLLSKGAKIYCNYGYFHLQQGPINGASSMAKLIKDSGLKTITLITMLTESACMKRKLRADGKTSIKGVTFKKAKYAGYKSLKSYDGDTFFEKVNGLKQLKKISGKHDVMLFNLVGPNSPYTKLMRFADFKRGGKHWKVDPNAAATDYFQYIILIKNSRANTPVEALE